MNLLIVSAMPHYNDASGQVLGWGPTVEEIDHLAALFHRIVHIGFLYPTPPPDSSIPYRQPNINFIPICPTGGETLTHKMGILKQAPDYLKTILLHAKDADVIHVRAPANISMLAILILALIRHPKYRWVKYAGNWQPKRSEPWSYAFQRWWLRAGLHRGTVSINGRWVNQPKHVVSFLNPCLTDSEVQQGRLTAATKKLDTSLNILFAGAVNSSKGFGRSLLIAKKLKDQGVHFQFDVVGDGPERPDFEAWTSVNGISSQVRFHGWLPKSALSGFYTQAHIILLPSNSEGWPKVLSEAMAYGAVPLAGAVSSIPQILGETGAGLALPFEDLDAYTQAILAYIEKPETWQAASQAGLARATQFTYSYYLQAVKDMFQNAWGIILTNRQEQPENHAG